LLEKLPDLFEVELLKSRLSPTDRAVLAQVARGFKEAVESSGLPRGGRSEGVLLKAVDFLVGRCRLKVDPAFIA